MTETLNSWITSFKKNERGSFVLEYALLAPLFMAITFGSIEMGRILMVYTTMEGAVTEATRIAMTGSVPEEYETTEAYIQHHVKQSLENVGVDAGVTISMKVYDSFSDVGAEEPYTDSNADLSCNNGEFYTDVNDNGTWDNDMGASGTGGEENIMVMEISVDLPYMMKGVVGIVSEEKSINLSTSTAVRNEPYGGVAWVPSDTVGTCA
tara:strand:+ start:382985 stop:383608 length:624 start_codon:yes stop_codon:yes gene_type:complete